MYPLARRSFTVLVLAGAVGGWRGATAAEPNGFVREAADALEFQVRAATLASTVATNKDIKEYAVAILPDHKAVLDKLKKVAGDGDTSASAAEAKLPQKYTDMLDKLRAAPTASFDALYVEIQIGTYRDLLVMFSNYSDKTEDAETRRVAAAFLPILKEHQARLEKLSKALPRPA